MAGTLDRSERSWRTPMSETEPRYPGESHEYRRARADLMELEVEARRAIEHAAAARRRLPPGGNVPEDYEFDGVGEGGDGTHKVRMSELFAPGKDTLAVYSFMFGPAMEEACPSCTSILDAMDGEAPHLEQRLNLVVVAKSPLPRILLHARDRGWRHLRLLSSADSTYNVDYLAEAPNGDQLPILNVFTRRVGEIHHFWGSEFLPSDPGQDPRHLDAVWPLWSVLDMTPDGRGDERDFPRLRYD
jgi:predicted dithiol-disulfide oxidoreductase (DUF899 family)